MLRRINFIEIYHSISEETSYGLHPGRSTQEAIWIIKNMKNKEIISSMNFSIILLQFGGKSSIIKWHKTLIFMRWKMGASSKKLFKLHIDREIKSKELAEKPGSALQLSQKGIKGI